MCSDSKCIYVFGLTMVFSGLLKYRFQPMLMTILKTPRVDNPAQPKYTPEGCSERRLEYPSVDKLAERRHVDANYNNK